MSKAKNEEEVLDGATVEIPETQQAVESGKTAFIDELLKNGTVVLTASSREELAEIVDNIPAECKYAVGAVGRKGDGSGYTLKVDTIKT